MKSVREDVSMAFDIMIKRLVYCKYLRRRHAIKVLGNEYGGYPVNLNMVHEYPVVYSFGIGADLSFSEACIACGAEVFAFDPTPKSIDFIEKSSLINNPRFHYFKYGLSSSNELTTLYLPTNDAYISASTMKHSGVKSEIQVEMKSLSSIMEELGHEYIDVLKMDIEGTEFEVLGNMDISTIRKIGQVCLEEHSRFYYRPNKKLGELLRCAKRLQMKLVYVSKQLDTMLFEVNK